MSDAPMYLAIGLAADRTGSANIRDVIAVYDALMVGYPVRDVFEASVSRLIAAGLVDTRGEELWLTNEGTHRFRSLTGERSATSILLELDADWAAHDFPPDAPSTWSVPPGVM